MRSTSRASSSSSASTRTCASTAGGAMQKDPFQEMTDRRSESDALDADPAKPGFQSFLDQEAERDADAAWVKGFVAALLVAVYLLDLVAFASWLYLISL